MGLEEQRIRSKCKPSQKERKQLRSTDDCLSSGKTKKKGIRKSTEGKGKKDKLGQEEKGSHGKEEATGHAISAVSSLYPHLPRVTRVCYDLDRAPAPPSVPPGCNFTDHQPQQLILPSNQPGAAASSSEGGESAPDKTEDKPVTHSQVKPLGPVPSEPDEDSKNTAFHLPVVELAGPEGPLISAHGQQAT